MRSAFAFFHRWTRPCMRRAFSSLVPADTRAPDMSTAPATGGARAASGARASSSLTSGSRSSSSAGTRSEEGWGTGGVRALGDEARVRCDDAALRAVKQRRNNRFKGLTRVMVAFRRLRLRAAQAVYAPGGAGFAAAAASVQAAAAGMG